MSGGLRAQQAQERAIIVSGLDHGGQPRRPAAVCHVMPAKDRSRSEGDDQPGGSSDGRAKR